MMESIKSIRDYLHSARTKRYVVVTNTSAPDRGKLDIQVVYQVKFHPGSSNSMKKLEHKRTSLNKQ